VSSRAVRQARRSQNAQPNLSSRVEAWRAKCNIGLLLRILHSRTATEYQLNLRR